jgi:hypothetical protein
VCVWGGGGCQMTDCVIESFALAMNDARTVDNGTMQRSAAQHSTS